MSNIVKNRQKKEVKKFLSKIQQHLKTPNLTFSTELPLKQKRAKKKTTETIQNCHC